MVVPMDIVCMTSYPFGAIVTWDNSRFARNREDAVTYKALLKRHGVRLFFVNEPLIEGPVGSLVDSVLEALADRTGPGVGPCLRCRVVQAA